MNKSLPMLRRTVPLLLFLALILLTSSTALACPNCKAGLSTSDPQAKNMAAGYYYSILFMISMPFLIVTSFSAWMYFAVRKAKAEREAKASRETAADAELAHASETATPGAYRE